MNCIRSERRNKQSNGKQQKHAQKKAETLTSEHRFEQNYFVYMQLFLL